MTEYVRSMVFINYMSGANLEYTARVGVNDRSTVRVRYLLAESITSKFGLTYANQNVTSPVLRIQYADHLSYTVGRPFRVRRPAAWRSED